MSLLDVLRGVMLDPAEQAAYNENPAAYLQRYGYDDVDPADLSEAFGLVADTLPADQAQAGLSATVPPGSGTFGEVTPDFDGPPDAEGDGTFDPTADPAFDTTAGEAGPGEPEADIDPDIPLSFGHGEDAPAGAGEPGDDPAALRSGDDAGPDATHAGPEPDGGDLAAGLGDTVGADARFDDVGDGGFDDVDNGGFDADGGGYDPGGGSGYDTDDDGGFDAGTDPSDLDIGMF